ncbi:MAG: 2Fe-2S iron-sulfur cluster-binding protein [Cyclobacteriaceae bacterium]
MAFNFFKKKETSPKPVSGIHYYELSVREVVQETKDAVSLIFEQVQPELTYRAGQFLTLIFSIEGKEVRRAYSLCSSPVTDLHPAVAIKRVEGGLVSNYIANHVKKGDKIRVMAPAGHFTVDFSNDASRHLILFAGGSGITPMLSLIKTLLFSESRSRCTLVYANRNQESIIFKDELDKLQAASPDRFRIFYLLDQAGPDWRGFTGFLTADILQNILNQVHDAESVSTTYMLCGPEAMMKNAEALLIQRGISSDSIRHESFTAAVSDSAKQEKSEGSAKSREVLIRYDAQEFRIMVDPDKTILASALEKGIDLPYSCQSGLCTACRGKAISGKVKLDEEDGLSKSELEEGYVLTCVGHPLTDDVVIEIG